MSSGIEANRLVVARHHLDTGNPQRALEVISQLDAGELQGTESEAYEIAADAHHRLGNDPAANDWVMRSLAADPSNVDAMRTGAWVASSLGDRRRVAELMDRALAIAPHHPLVLVDCTMLLTDEGRLTEAAGFLERARTVAPDSQPVLLAGMTLAAARNDVAEASVLARRVLADDPENLHALAVDADLAELRGDSTTAAARARKVASLRLGDEKVASLAREAMAWNHPVVRPYYWILHHPWAATVTLPFMVIWLVMVYRWGLGDVRPPMWFFVPAGIVVAYSVGCMWWVERKSDNRTMAQRRRELREARAKRDE